MLFPSLRSNLFFQDKTVRICLVLSLFLIIISLVALYFRIAPQIEPVYLRYSVYFGIDLIGAWWLVFLLPLSGFLALLLNFYLAYVLFLKSNILSYFLTLTTVALQIFLLIISFLIILLNN